MKATEVTNQEKLKLADTVAKKKVVTEGMGVRGFVVLVKILKIHQGVCFSKNVGSRTIPEEKYFFKSFINFFK